MIMRGLQSGAMVHGKQTKPRNESISGFVSANESECCDFLCKGQRSFNDTYNDIADGLAKQALESALVNIQMPIPMNCYRLFLA